MSGKFPALNYNQVVNILLKAGFVFDRQGKGDHVQYVGSFDGQKRHVTIPDYGNDTFGPGLIKKIYWQAGMTKKEFYSFHEKKR